MRLRCYHCGESVSTEVPDDTIVRAILECPECIEKTTGPAQDGALSRAAWRRETDAQVAIVLAANMGFDDGLEAAARACCDGFLASRFRALKRNTALAPLAGKETDCG